ncbi:MAG: ABC transporter ATP-binding protein [Chloroflexota bacterium]
MTFKQLWHLAIFRPWLTLSVVALWLIYSLSPALAGLLTKRIFDALTGNAVISFNIWMLVLLLLVVELGAVGLLVGWYHAHNVMWQTLEHLIRRNVFQWLLEKSDISVSKMSPGETVNRLGHDTELALDPLNEWYRVLGDALFAVIAFIIMVQISPFITIAAIVPLGIIVVSMHMLGARLEQYRAASRQAAEQVSKFIGEMFGAVQAVKVVGAEAAVVGRFRKINDTRHRTALKDAVFNSFIASYYNHITTISIGVILLLGASAISDGDFTIGDFALFVLYLEWMMDFPRRVGRVMVANKLSKVSTGRLDGLLSGQADPVLTAHQPVYLDGTLPQVEFQPKGSNDRVISFAR